MNIKANPAKKAQVGLILLKPISCIGYQLMADVLVKAMKKVLIHPIINPVAEDDF